MKFRRANRMPRLTVKQALLACAMGIAGVSANISMTGNTFSGATGVEFSSGGVAGPPGPAGESYHIDGLVSGTADYVRDYVKPLIDGPGGVGSLTGESNQFSWTISRGDDVVRGAYGTNTTSGQPYAEDASLVMQMNSITKVVAYSALMKLWDEGLVKLDAPVSDYVGEPANGFRYPVLLGETEAPPNGELALTRNYNTSTTSCPEQIRYYMKASRAPRVRDVMMFRGGFGVWNFGESCSAQQRDQVYLDEMADAIAALNLPAPGGTDIFDHESYQQYQAGVLNFEPNSQFGYGHDSEVVGLVLEKAMNTPGSTRLDAGYKRLHTILKEKVTGPLGMSDTFFFKNTDDADFGGVQDRFTGAFMKGVDGAAGSGTAWGSPSRDQVNWFTYTGDVNALDSVESMCCGIKSSTDDVSKLLRMYLKQGIAEDGTRFIRRSTARLFTAEQELPDEPPNAAHAKVLFRYESFAGAMGQGNHLVESETQSVFDNKPRMAMDPRVLEEAYNWNEVGSNYWAGWCGTVFHMSAEDDMAYVQGFCSVSDTPGDSVPWNGLMLGIYNQLE